MSGQTITDRLTAARYSIAGQGLAKSVCKATTEEAIGPKKKHLDYLLHCTNEPNVSIPHLANLLIERTQYNNWVVVFKALITVHNLMCYGNERFTQYLASSNCNFQLSNFLDKSGVAGPGQSYDMSTYIRRYAKYLNEKAVSYRGVAFDFCKVKRGKKDGTLRTMGGEELLKTLPVLQAQIDALLEFDCTSNELRNGVINSAFVLLFRDLIRLFACYNDGIINLLEKFFEMNKKQCREALDIYKKFLIRMDRVAEFLKVAENAGIDKGDIPDLTKAPSSLLDALEAHLANLEGKKPPTSSAVTSQQQSKVNISSAVTALSSTSTAFGNAANSTRVNELNGSPHIDETLKSQVLAEEEAALNQYKEQHLKTNPFLSSPVSEHAPATTTEPVVDIFGSSSAPGTQQSQAPKASDDLLQLTGNPFGDILGGGGATTNANAANPAPAANMWAAQPAAPQTQQNGFLGLQTAQHAPSNENFASESSFAAAFGAPSTTQSIFGYSPAPNIMNTAPPPGFDAFGDILQPQGMTGAAGPVPSASPAHRGVPQQQAPQPAAPTKVLTGDLESSLASLAENLTMKGSSKGSSMWGSPKNTAKTGGPQFSQPTSGAPMRPMGGMAPGGQQAGGMGFFAAPQGSNPMQPRPTGMQTGGAGVMMGAPVSSNTQLDPFGAL